MKRKFTLTNSISSEETEYGTVILDRNSGKYWNLNPTGSVIYRAILEGKSLVQAAAALQSHYAVDKATATGDAENLLKMLLAERILVEYNRGDP